MQLLGLSASYWTLSQCSVLLYGIVVHLLPLSSYWTPAFVQWKAREGESGKMQRKRVECGKERAKGREIERRWGWDVHRENCMKYSLRVNTFWLWIYIAVYRFDSAAAAIVVLIALPDSPQNLSAIVCDCDIRKTNCEYIGKAFQSCCMQGKKPHTKALHVQYIRWQAEN